MQLSNYIRQLTQMFILVLMVSFSFNSLATQISPQQIEQFKRLPKAQQQALAKSMGVDLNVIMGQISNSGTPNQTVNTPIYPRGTLFDQTGAPMVPPFAEQQLNTNIDPEETELVRFGADVFANAPSTFSPNMDIAIPEGYILGVGDQLSVQIYGTENTEYQLAITREGTIIIPDVGPVKIAGLSFAEMKSFLAERIKQRIIGVNVALSLAELRSMRVFVLGDAHKPGPYTLSSLSTVTHALFAAGGVNDIGSLRNIQVKRAGKLVQKVDLYDLLINGDSSSDILLQSGDVVFIPSQGKSVAIDGEVRRPAIYELNDDSNFADVLTMAGGLLPSAYPQLTMIERYHHNQLPSIINIDFSDAKQLALVASNGDKITVKPIADIFNQAIELTGAVVHPGNYQWKKDIRISDIVVGVKSHLQTNADLHYSLIVREVGIVGHIEVLQFSLTKALSSKDHPDNIKLMPSDEIIIFDNANGANAELDLADEQTLEQFIPANIEEMTMAKLKAKEKTDAKEDLLKHSREKLLSPVLSKLKLQAASGKPLQLIEVDGEVKFPGVYPKSNNVKVSDLIAAAGGVKESAYLTRAEITRNTINDAGAEKTSLHVDLSVALQGDDNANIVLESKDRLNIHKIPAWSENHVVELKGEFVFPGKYTISRGETMAELIEKAGGLTKYAHAQGSVFSRKKLKALEQQNLIKLAGDLRIEMASKSLTEQGVSASYDDAQKLLADITGIEPVGRLVIDLPKVMSNDHYDVLLEDGDVLFVPTKKSSINVIGQVQVGSSHMFDDTMSVEDYIGQSGGMKKRADEDRVYVISANGSIKMLEQAHWFAASTDSALKAGDTIVVPLDAEYMNDLTLWSTATQIIYNAAVAVAAINGI